jgi:microsomal epoxide hydrolase
MPRPEGITDDGISELEKQGLERSDEFKRLGSAYALQHATKPSTIGFVLAANPLSLLAWYVTPLLDSKIITRYA